MTAPGARPRAGSGARPGPHSDAHPGTGLGPATVRLGTKAETLERLAPLVTSARVLPLAYFSLGRWQACRQQLLDGVLAHAWAAGPLIVRSSALSEDTAAGSQAGRFCSLSGRRGRAELAAAVDEVFASYDTWRPGNQVLIQPELTHTRLSGVACSCDPSSGAPYTVVNWSEDERTDTVTGGRRSPGLHISYGAAYDSAVQAPCPLVAAVWRLLAQLTELTGEPRLDIEFAQTTTGELILLQARPVAASTGTVPPHAHRATLSAVADRIAQAGRAAPRVLGERPVFGVMPDWNPAEMIGLRPRPLALSLYRRLITDSVWARARHRYGYRDLRGVPVLVDFAGLAYIDVRASVTSFIPRDVPTGLAARLADHWLDRLVAAPHLHDKLESRIVLSAHGFRTGERLAELAAAGFDEPERTALAGSLHRLTDELVTGDLWEEDLALLDAPPAALRHAPRCADGSRPGCCGPALAARLDLCAERGTLPFAALARAAFIATELLADLVAENVFTPAEKAAFISGLDLVAGVLQRDFRGRDREDFLKKYGHLRPGTYDILSPRYDEAPDRYFDWSRHRHGPTDAPGDGHHPPTGRRHPPTTADRPRFEPSAAQLGHIERLIAREGFSFTPDRLLEFIGATVRGREQGKFAFTAQLSDVLTDIRLLGERHGLDAETMSYVPFPAVAALSGDPVADRRALTTAADRGRTAYAVSRTIALPPLVTAPSDALGFVVPQAQPNFVTQGRVLARVADIDAGDPPEGAIALIAGADPGYDWLFARGIAGLVTAFGGANSHMAIRALELDIPSVIGVGEAQFRQLAQAGALDLDAACGMLAALP
ncbi:PEP-utilizing enzyme [Streptomyces sp. NPDC059788]|uniref:PEP-utilizing enzyme n=1 Tax=Streptomyces sp. NPDC059788 TaxID=3346948 RepID=UPI00364ABBD0